MEINYQIGATSDNLKAIETKSGLIYHQLFPGQIAVKTSERDLQLAPVNRSYAPRHSGNRLFTSTDDSALSYQKDKLVHESVRGDLAVAEFALNLAGRDFLYLDTSAISETYPSLSEHSRRSVLAKELLCELNHTLVKSHYNYYLGVYGSHQLGLQSVDSDLDLVAVTSSENRASFLESTNQALAKLAFSEANSSDKLWEYAQRYANRFNLPLAAGEYLARKRLRWENSQGLELSLQLLNDEFPTAALREFWQIWQGDWESELIQAEVEVIESKSAFNFPRYWQLGVSDRILPAYSFCWTHQGMGTSQTQTSKENSPGAKFLCKALLIRSGSGKELIFLRDPQHFLLPVGLS